MIDLNDHIHQRVSHRGKYRQNKLYRAYCDACGADRGYQPKSHGSKSCNRCASAQKKVLVKIETFDSTMNTVKKSINGRVRWLDSCKICNKNKGFVCKHNIGKACKSCSNRANKLGKPSPKKGIKTGKPAWNRSEYFDNDIKRTIRDRVSRRMRHALNNRSLSKKWQHVFDMLGYTVEDLKKHLESRFQSGMSWENRGEWHIDHVVPDSWFTYNSIDDEGFKKSWSLENLQPLWASDNCRKGAKYGTSSQ